MKTSERVLFDTNVLVYNQDVDSVFYDRAANFHRQAFEGKIKAVVSSQNLLEFAAVMTNPKKITKPLSNKITVSEINKYVGSGYFEIIYPNTKTIALFTKMLKGYKFSDPKRSFDLFLAATMVGNGVRKILTANDKDFNFKEIEIVKLA